MGVLDKIKNKQSELMILDIVEFNGIPGKVQADSSDIDELLELADIGDRMRWVKTSDRLPETSNEVIISDGRFILGGYGWYGDYFSNDYDDNIPLSEVTHWMQMPIPPSPVDEN